MEFGMNGEQVLLKNEVRRFLENECTTDHVREMMGDERGYAPSIWKKMADLGFMGIAFDEAYGGTGGRFSDLSILLHEMGRVLLASPYFSTVVSAGMTIALSGDGKTKERFLPGIVSGDTLMTLALTEEEADYTLDDIQSRGEQKGQTYILKGRKTFVPHAHVAHYIIVPARTGEGDGPRGVSLLVVDAKSKGVSMTPLLSVSLEKQSELTFSDVSVPGDCVIGDRGDGWRLVRKLWPVLVTAKCCEMVGAMERVLEISLGHVQKDASLTALCLPCRLFSITAPIWQLSWNAPGSRRMRPSGESITDCLQQKKLQRPRRGAATRLRR